MHTWIIHVQVAVELCKVVSPQAISLSLPDADNGMNPKTPGWQVSKRRIPSHLAQFADTAHQ